MKNKKSLLTIGLLTLIFIAGLLIRSFLNYSIPDILNRDEAALAYNGLMINQIGKDEFGVSYPLTFESFGDYKLPGYPYTLAALFSFAPIDDATVRIPSIVAGSILILLSFWLAKELKLKNYQALFFSFITAISPIFIFYSRIAFEANVALSFLVLFLIFLIRFSNKPKLISLNTFAIVTSIIMAISFYNTPLLLLPFIILGTPFLLGLKKPKKWFPLIILLGIIFTTTFTALNTITSQKAGITIFSDETTWTNYVTYRETFTGITKLILGNKYAYYLKIILSNLILSFSPHFLVTSGGTHPWHNLPNWGHLYWSVYVLGWIGLLTTIYQQLKNFKLKKFLKTEQPQLFLLFLTIASLAPSVITVDAPHATRSLLFIYLWLIWATFAIRYFKKILLIPLVLILFIESGWYLNQYFNHYINNQPQSLKTGFDSTINFVEEEHGDKLVAIVDPDGYQYILTAWYLQIDPQVFLDTVIKQLPNRIGFKYGQQLTHYHFIAHPDDRINSEKVLVEWDNQKQKWITHIF
jgi:hypothetical protein